MNKLWIQQNILILCFMALSYIGSCQTDTLRLNLESLLKYSKANSLIIDRINAEKELSLIEWSKSKEWWAPNIFIGSRIHQLNGAAMNTDGVIFTDLDRQNKWLGGDISASWAPAEDIFKSQSAKYRANAAVLKSQQLKNEQILQIIETYYSLLEMIAKEQFLSQLVIDKSNVLDGMKNQLDEGLLLESEYLIVKSNTQRLKMEILNLQQAIESLENQLKSYLNLDNNMSIVIDLELIVPINLNTEISSDKVDVSLHPSLQEMEELNKAFDAEHKSTSLAMLVPEAGINYQLGSFGESYSNSYSTNSINAFVGWNFPLGRLIYNSDNKISKQKKIINQLRIDENKLTLNNVVHSLQKQISHLRESISLSESSIDISKRALDLSQERLDNNIGTSFELLSAQYEFIQANIMYIKSVCDYNNLQYQLFIQSGNNF